MLELGFLAEKKLFQFDNPENLIQKKIMYLYIQLYLI